MKFLRVARLDDSDERVYSPAAQAGELAVTGTFVFSFSDDDPERLTGKQRQAYRTGFLGLDSFGWSTVVIIADVTEAEYKGAIESLARHFVSAFGAPSLQDALPVARQEIEYAAGLCEHEVGTLLALERHADEDGVHEAIRRVQQRPAEPERPDWNEHSGEIRIWDMFPDKGKT